MRTVLTASFILALAASAAMAGSERSNAAAAKNMAETLSATPGTGAAAPSVSGKDAKSDSGWGNAGSRVVAGDQVSRGNK